MTYDTPPGGFPMRGAITALARPEDAETVKMHDELLFRGAWAMLADERHHLWQGIIARAYAGELIVRAVKAGENATIDLTPTLLRGSVPDYDKDQLLAGGTLFVGVGVFPASETLRIEIQAPLAKGRGGRNAKYDWKTFNQEVVRFAHLVPRHSGYDSLVVLG